MAKVHGSSTMADGIRDIQGAERIVAQGAAQRNRRGGHAERGAGWRLLPAAGPHAVPELTNLLATPGTGLLPRPGRHDEMDCITG
jgi:hypothetical protein